MLFIRVDMNEEIATGHMHRCMAIADAAKKLGEETTFLVADEQSSSLLKKQGRKYYVLNTPWNNMEEELPELIRIIRDNEVNKLLIDSYSVTEKYLSAVNEKTSVYYIDDLNLFKYPVDSIINYTNYWPKFHYKDRYPDTTLYLGLEYAPLREKFSNCPTKTVRPEMEKLLILSGGTDKYGVLLGILNALNRDRFQRIDVIGGSLSGTSVGNNDFRRDNKVVFHSYVENIDQYIKEADLVISAAGTTLYEICACGTPAISYVIADNQLDNAKQFEQDEMIAYAGDARTDNIYDRINVLISEYEKDFCERKRRSGIMQFAVDGNGALRIAELLKG